MSSQEIEHFLDYIGFWKTQEKKLPTFPDEVGWYDTCPPPSAAHESLEFFFDYFRESVSSCQLVSSLTDFTGAARYWAKGEGQRLAAEFTQRGWFRLGKNKDEALRDFSMSSLDAESVPLLKKLCLLEFQLLTFGYLFFYWKDLGLVAFPTKDEGFAFLAKETEPGFKIAQAFLQSIAISKGFRIEGKTLPPDHSGSSPKI